MDSDQIADCVAPWCKALHRGTGHFCARPRGHDGYHRSGSGAIWIHRYIRYGKLDANGQPLHSDGRDDA